MANDLNATFSRRWKATQGFQFTYWLFEARSNWNSGKTLSPIADPLIQLRHQLFIKGH
uniref:Uncharacterized protein n=1 Tax=mine drainage metagenome TaxID=410659 RepID=E6QB28_9ZZZZ